MLRTQSAAAGVAAPESLLSESASNAAAAAKTRHNCNLAQQASMQQRQPQTTQSADADLKFVQGKQQVAMAHQGSIDENALESQAADTVKAPAPKPLTEADSSQPPASNYVSRTRSLPPKPKAAKTRSAKPAAATPVQKSASAEHAILEEPAMPTAKPLSSTLAGLAQGLAASRNNNKNSTSDAAAAAVPEQIDLEFDFSNDSDDSDFQLDKEPVQAEDEVIDLSQEDPLDVVKHGLVSIRSPVQAGAAAAGEASDDDDEEEFQQVTGKRKQPAKTAAKGMILVCTQVNWHHHHDPDNLNAMTGSVIHTTIV